MIAEGKDEPRKGEESEDDVHEELVMGDKGEPINYIVQHILLTPKVVQHNQRHSIFKTRCTIKNRVCNVIIDSGSCENIVLKALINALELKTDKHPRPYKMSWI